MNKQEVWKEIGKIDREIIMEAEGEWVAEKKQPKGIRAAIVIAACVSLFVCLSVTALAVNYVKQQEDELYLRYLSPAAINLQQTDLFEPERFFKALHSQEPAVQYIAINRLVECFNEEALRQKAIAELEPFVENGNEKIAQAAMFALTILKKEYDSDYIYALSDGSVMFTLFHNYSDYGSYNVLWRIKDDMLEQYMAFSAPSMYITDIILSPNGDKLAVATCSNKSQYLVIVDPVQGRISPELVSTGTIIYGGEKGYLAQQRIDHENYAGIQEVKWANNDTLTFDASLSYRNTEIIEHASVTYSYSDNNFIILEKAE